MAQSPIVPKPRQSPDLGTNRKKISPLATGSKLATPPSQETDIQPTPPPPPPATLPGLADTTDIPAVRSLCMCATPPKNRTYTQIAHASHQSKMRYSHFQMHMYSELSRRLFAVSRTCNERTNVSFLARLHYCQPDHLAHPEEQQ